MTVVPKMVTQNVVFSAHVLTAKCGGNACFPNWPARPHPLIED